MSDRGQIDKRTGRNKKVLVGKGLQSNWIKHLCPKNLTFPKAEREQRCPRLVVFIFCLFISIYEFDWFTAANDKSDWQIEKNKQKTTATKSGHSCSRSAFGKVRFFGHLSHNKNLSQIQWRNSAQLSVTDFTVEKLRRNSKSLCVGTTQK